MKKTVLFSAIGVVAASFGQAASAQETARVLSSTPVVQQVAVPRQVCSAQPVAQQSSGGGAVIGAIVGGLLGNTIGHGMGRAAATGVGVVAGAGIGDSIENRGPQYAQQCTTQTSYENRTVGYNVVYEYAGKQYSTQMAYDPGQSIRLQLTPVGAAPVAPQAAAMPAGPGVAQPVIVAPPIGQGAMVQPQMAGPSYDQPVATIIPSTVVYPATYPAAYPVYGAPYSPYYYRAPAYYPPIALSLNFGYSRGWGGGYHHWR